MVTGVVLEDTPETDGVTDARCGDGNCRLNMVVSTSNVRHDARNRGIGNRCETGRGFVIKPDGVILGRVVVEMVTEQEGSTCTEDGKLIGGWLMVDLSATISSSVKLESRTLIKLSLVEAK